MNFFKLFLVISLIVLPGLFYYNKANGRPDLVAPIKATGDRNYPPYEFINEDGEPDGFNIELLNAIQRVTGLNIQVELVPWMQALEKMRNKEVDMLTGVMYSNRMGAYIRFSVPYVNFSHALFVRQGSPIRTIDDLRGMEVIVRAEGRLYEYLIETGLTDYIIGVGSQVASLERLSNGYHDAAILGEIQGQYLLEHLGYTNLEMHSLDIISFPYSFGIQHDNLDLLAAINSGIAELMATGEYHSIYRRWFVQYEPRDFWPRNRNFVIGLGIFLSILFAFIILLRHRVKVATHHLHESEQRYRNIFHNDHSVMLLIDPGTEQIVDANPAAEKFYGWSYRQLTSMKISQINLLTPKEVREQMQKAKEKKENNFKFRHILSNGEQRDVEVHSGSIILKKKNLLFSIIHDVTDRNQALEQNKSWQNLLQYIITHAPSTISVHDLKMKYIFVSDRYLKSYGLKEDILGKTPEEVLPDYKEKWEYIYKKALEGEATKEDEDQLMKPDGTLEFIRWRCLPWYTPDGSVAGFITYMEIITERKKAEELRYNLEIAKKTTQIKQTFLASLSHEMRTPLNGIIGLANYLAKSDLNEEQAKHLRIIIDSSKTLLQLINQVLDLSKIESGQMTTIIEEVSAFKLVEKLYNSFDFLFKEKGVQYSINVHDNFPSTFIYDEQQLLQVLNNLISNALKFTDQGEVKVDFTRKVNQHQQEELLVSISDTGTGIDEEYHDTVFMEFIQVHDPKKTNYSGTGLGLPISKKIVESLGGEMGLKSKKGKGSTFWFTIIPEKITEKPIDTVEEIQSFLPLELSVLLVEDKKVNRIVAELLLSDMGCSVQIAENGLVAVEKVKHNDFDVILMDIQMPVMDGIMATIKLRSMGIKLPPIIGLSAEAMEGDAEKYIQMGMDDYITKPIDANILYKKLKFHTNS
jgi:PAS domain S-box-containing protein